MLAGFDLYNKHVRHTAVGQPVVPIAEAGCFDDEGLYLRVVAVPQALRLLLFGRELRPHPGEERDALAVGKPLERRSARGNRCQPARLATGRRDQVDLRLLVTLALGEERDPVPIGRPRRGAAAPRMRGQTPLR